MIYFSLALGLILIVFLSFSIYSLWLKYLNNKMVKGFLFPGSVVHELSHALLCLVTGTTIKELNIFSIDDSGIQYDKPKVPFIFDFFIASAPIFGCTVLIFLMMKVLSTPVQLEGDLPRDTHFSFSGIYLLIQQFFSSTWSALLTMWDKFRIKNIHHIFFLLAMIAFTVSMAPHRQDIKHLILGFLFFSILFFFIEVAGLQMFEYRWWNSCLTKLWVLTVLNVAVLCMLLFVTLTIMGIFKGYRLTFGQKSSGRK